MYREIEPAELATWRDEGKEFVLLDVRDDDELRAAAIEGATHIPMVEIPQRAVELDKDATIAVLCHHGGRSARVAQFLTMQGYSNIYNVDGGIDAYSRIVDNSIPRY